MIRTVRLQNYTSFGELQEAPLQAITVIVGANNTGKTNFLRFVDFVRTSGTQLPTAWHRPLSGDGDLVLDWESDLGPGTENIARYTSRFSHDANGGQSATEGVILDGRPVFVHRGEVGKDSHPILDDVRIRSWPPGLSAPRMLLGLSYDDPNRKRVFRSLFNPILDARHVHLRVETLRAEAQVQQDPSIDEQGSNLAPLIAHWLLEEPEKMERFNRIIATCLPEMRQVHARCVNSGMVRLSFEQRDGERFDSQQVSDGVLVFAGLIAHALEAPKNALVMLEEPERGIHPRRLRDLVDILRTLVEERGTQFILATHSPALLNQFRDEPESILTFRRGPKGTIITPLAARPDIAEVLSRADPGDLLASGAFNEGTDSGDGVEVVDSNSEQWR